MADTKTSIEDLPLAEQVDRLRKQFVIAIVFAFGMVCGWSLGNGGK